MKRKQLKKRIEKMKKATRNRKNKKLRNGPMKKSFKFKYNQKILFFGLIFFALLILISSVFLRDNYAQKKTENQAISELFSSSENMICKEFHDNVLWTSGYSDSPEGSEKYQTWMVGNSCPEAKRTDCFLQNISVNARVLYVNPLEIESNRKGYLQISNPDESICDSPEKGIYSKYLVSESINGAEEQALGWYCGEKIYPDSKCGIKLDDRFNDETKCYGIKAYSSQYLIVDAVRIKYSWCWKKQN